MKKRLADIVEVRTGFPFRGRVTPAPEGTLSVVQMKDVSDVGGLNSTECIRINEEQAHQRHLLEVGDVILQSRGNKFPAGVIDAPIHGIAALGLHVLRPKQGLVPEYLAWVMNHPSTRATLQSVARGSYVPFISKTEIEELRVPVPPVAAQHQIIEVERLYRREHRLLSELQDLKTQFFNAAAWQAATRKQG